MKKGFTIFFILAITVLINKEIAMGRSDYKVEIREKYRQLDLSNGVTKEEAIIIAQNYILKEGLDKSYIITKFSVEEWGLRDELWRIVFKATYAESIKQGNIFGFLGVFKWWISVSVDKKTGEIKSVGGPDL